MKVALYARWWDAGTWQAPFKLWQVLLISLNWFLIGLWAGWLYL